MKMVKKYFVFGMLMTAGLIFAGCGETTDTKPADSGSSSPTDGDDEAGSADKSDGASMETSGDFQLVSLNVPNMT